MLIATFFINSHSCMLLDNETTLEMKYYFPVLLCFFMLLSTYESKAQKDTTNQSFYNETVKPNGVRIITDVSRMAFTDVQKILNYNFDQYRAYDKRITVRLSNGPSIELLSLTERLAQGKAVDITIVEKAKSTAACNYKYAVTTILNIGIGYKAPVTEREKTTIFMTPKATR
jgi:hypothetical protein